MPHAEIVAEPRQAETPAASGHWPAGLAAVSLGLILSVGLLGGSAAVVPLGPGRWPFDADAHPSPWLVSMLLLAAVLLGAGSVGLGWRALRRGWAPDPRRLLAAAVVAVGLIALVPPVAAGDPTSYASYGRIASRGLDPYVVAPNDLPHDPVTRHTEYPWQGTPSPYGPLATAEQALAGWLGGGQERLTVGLVDLFSSLGFLLGAWALWAAAGDDVGRRRVLLLYALNPVLWLEVVAGGHLDAIAAALVVAMLLAARRSSAGGGAVAALAVLVKLTAGLPALGLAWVWRRRPRRLVAAAVAGAVLLVAGYAPFGIGATSQTRAMASFVTVASPWRWVRSELRDLSTHTVAGIVLTAGSLLLWLLMSWALARGLPRVDREELVPAAARAGLVVFAGFTLATTYVLPWYDCIAWALIVLLPASRWDLLLLAHTTALSLGYLPGRAVHLPAGLAGLAGAARANVAPVCMVVIIAVTLAWGYRRIGSRP